MKLLIKEIELLNDIKNKYNIESKTYFDIILFIKNAKQLEYDEHLQNEIKNFIVELEVPLLKSNIASILNIEDEDSVSIENLNYTQLFNCLGRILYTVSITEKDNLLLFKYNKSIWNAGWHKLAIESRGKIIDRNTLEIVSYPFDKFFNLNENTDNDESIVLSKISKAKEIYTSDKKDGSTIIVSNYNGNNIITTNGSFCNEQTSWAIDIFNKKYIKFINNVPVGYTFIFELIHPENKIIINYGDEENLYLLAIRNLKSFKLLNFEELKHMAEIHDLILTEFTSFSTLKELELQAQNLKDANKEGWVIRIISDNDDFMFKLKLQEYFLLHRAKSSISFKSIYHLCKEKTYEELYEFLENVNDEIKEEIIGISEQIDIYMRMAEQEVAKKANKILIDHNLELNDFGKDRELMVKIIKDLKTKETVFGPFIINYLKKSKNVFSNTSYQRFIQIQEYFVKENAMV